MLPKAINLAIHNSGMSLVCYLYIEPQIHATLKHIHVVQVFSDFTFRKPM